MTRTARPHVVVAEEKLDALITSYREAGTPRLPRETELSEHLGISRNTLREALARLEANGVIERRRRLGTFIVPGPESAPVSTPARPRYPIDEIVSIASFLESTGTPFTIRSVAVQQEPASADAAEQLGLSAGDPVYRVRRVYDVDGTAVAIGEHLIPAVLRGHEVHIEALTYGVSTFLRDVEQIPVDRVEHTVVPVLLDASSAHEFQLAAGSPALLVEAQLMSRDSDRWSVVAYGRLTFNPLRIAVGATGRQPS
ncbi:MAG: GntR family transcriptional regulator [Protaetiibacter sp.]